MSDLWFFDLDILAVVWFLMSVVGYGYITGSRFLLPLSITGATGSMVRPVALV